MKNVLKDQLGLTSRYVTFSIPHRHGFVLTLDPIRRHGTRPLPSWEKNNPVESLPQVSTWVRVCVCFHVIQVSKRFVHLWNC